MKWWGKLAATNDVAAQLGMLTDRLGEIERRLDQQDEKAAKLAMALIERIEAVRSLTKKGCG